MSHPFSLSAPCRALHLKPASLPWFSCCLGTCSDCCLESDAKAEDCPSNRAALHESMLVVCLCAFSAITEDSVERRLGGKLLRQFTEARQQCCHPQIVRRDLWLGKSRLSMRQILTRLVHKAFSEYDIAVRAEFTARILQAAVSCDPADAGDLPSPSFPQ